jgi:RND family efflux transporter MFP subunit
MNIHQTIGDHSGAEFRQRLPAILRKRRALILLAIAAVILIALAFFLFRGSDATVPADGTDVPRVTVIVPGQTQISAKVSATGNLAALRDMPVGIAGEGGKVAAVLVDAGDYVAAGQVLARLDRAVETQQAAQLAAQLRAARADAALAQSELDRAAALVARGFISKADIDRRTATRDAARARVGLAEAQLGEMRARLGRLDIRAPAAGLVLERNLEAGQVVGSGSPALFRIAEGGVVELRARLPEQDLNRLKVGLPASVTPVGASKPVIGSVWLISPIVDDQTRQGAVRIRMPADRSIRPGGFASAEIVAGSIDAPLLPESAVQSDEKGSYVYIVGADGKVARREIEVASVSSQGIAVASGISGREQVVLSAAAFLNPGETVIAQRAAVKRQAP